LCVVRRGILRFVTGQGQEIGSCQLNAGAMRNVQGFTKVIVTMLNGKLRVKYAYPERDHWLECFSDADVQPVPRQSYYFGFTAATGDIADNHDVRSFAVYDLKAMSDAEGTDAAHHDHSDFELKARRAINRRRGSSNNDEITVWSVLWTVAKWILITVGLTLAVVLALSGYKVFKQRAADKRRPTLPGV
jgi:lectin, mannose-binding 2